jgi:CDP-6-deoxy-D-xylo-4-hexulose-3-dehydrase
VTWAFPTAFSSWRHGDGGAESAAIDRVLRSGQLTMASEVVAFESEFADWHGRKHGIMVNSGSSANLVAVAALSHGWFKGSRGVVPAIAWPTTYAPLRQYGLDFQVADCDGTWNAQDYAEENIGFLVVCSILGNPAYLEEYLLASEQLGPLLEDNCEALGARTEDEGRLTGTFGLLSTFSFFYSHQISAIEGGMILTDDDELAKLCRLMRNHGNDGWGNEDFDRSYNFTLFGYNVRPLEMHAAIAREQMKKLPQFIEARRANDDLFRSLTHNLLSVTPQRRNGQTSPFGLAFTVETTAQRRLLVGALRAEGIDCRLPTGGSFLKHPYGAPWREQKTPNANRIHDTGMFLGNAPYDISPLIERAVKVMRRVL